MDSSITLSKEQQSFWELIQKINSSWCNENLSVLEDYFHNDVVFNSPDFKNQIVGKENCVQTYIDFINSSKVLLYNESNPRVSLFANTAVVTYDFEMKYEQNNRIYHETGADIMVFERYQDSWKVIWRALSSLKNI